MQSVIETNWDKTNVIDSKSLNSFMNNVGDLAKISYTEAMLAQEEKRLQLERKSTEVLKQLKPILLERQKLFNERYKVILECMKHGFESEQERTRLATEFAEAFHEFKKVLAQLNFGFNQNAQATKGYLSAYN